MMVPTGCHLDLKPLLLMTVAVAAAAAAVIAAVSQAFYCGSAMC